MWKVIGLIVTAAVFNSCNAQVIDHNLVIPDGPILGNPRDGASILSFKGIPYAQPPVGNLRWKSPQPISKWTKVLNATQFGFTCWQGIKFFPIFTPQNEDCLTINVWTPAKTKQDKLAVMVWFHGGGFIFGGGGEKETDGTRLAQEGVVVVKFNYRLNAFGFLAHPELDEGDHYSGNYGLQDGLAALEWVKRNIAAFGGDPAKVTAFGESAGAHAIGLLMSSPLHKNLFHKAIMQSGSMWDSEHGALMPFDLARRNGTAFGVKLKATTAAQLRSVPAQTINDMSEFKGREGPGIACFTPNVDKNVVPDHPASASALKRQLRIPTLAGWNRLEGNGFIGIALPWMSKNQFRSRAQAYFGDRTAEFLRLYPSETISQVKDSAIALMGDLIISQQTWEIGDTLRQGGESNVYLYHYNYSSLYSPSPNHGVDFAFVFGNLEAGNKLINPKGVAPAEADFAFSAKLRTYWANFAKYSDPNGKGESGLPVWPKYAADGTGIFGLDDTFDAVKYDLSRFRFLKSLRKDGLLPAHWMSIQ
jgi:para-nitrobenzyl esterase